MLRAVAELARLLVLFIIFASVIGLIVNPIYGALNVSNSFPGYYLATAIIIMFFVLYRNKLQWSGWYKGKNIAELTTPVSRLLMTTAIALLVAPPVTSLFI